MKINKNHLYHGSAIAQVVEHDKFISIKTFEQNGTYEINENAILALKYAKEPKGNSYQFVFSKENVRDLYNLRKEKENIFLGLICFKGREICCLSYKLFRNLIKLRRAAVGSREDNYIIRVVLIPQKRMRVYIDLPKSLVNDVEDPIVLPRSAFPSVIFEV